MAPVAVTVIVAAKGLSTANSPAVFMDRVTGLVPVVVVPDEGVSVSQLVPVVFVSDQVNVPVPGFVIFNVCEAGLAAP